MKFWNIYFCSFGCQQGAFQVVYRPKKRVGSFLFLFFLNIPGEKETKIQNLTFYLSIFTCSTNPVD